VIDSHLLYRACNIFNKSLVQTETLTRSVWSTFEAWRGFTLQGALSPFWFSQFCGVGATWPLSRDGVVEELTETQKSGHASRSGPEVKNGSVPKMARRRGSDAGKSRRGIRSCRVSTQALQEEFFQRFVASTWCCDPRPLSRGGPKWWDNFSEWSDHPVTRNRLVFHKSVVWFVFQYPAKIGLKVCWRVRPLALDPKVPYAADLHTQKWSSLWGRLPFRATVVGLR